MPAANIEINGVAASNLDAPLNTLVQLSNLDTGGETTYLWSIVDQPEGAADALSSTAIENPTFTPRKEGTYLLQLIVNNSLATEVRDRKVVAVRQLKSRGRIPAAAETVEADVAKGWKVSTNGILQQVDDVLGDANIVACTNGTLGNLSPGTVVEFRAVGVIKSGLPGEERLPAARVAAALLAHDVAGTLGVVIGAADGGTWTTTKVGLVRVFGLYENTVAGTPALNDPVFVSDAGAMALTPGTVPRVVGRVVEVSGGAYRVFVEGATRRTDEVVRTIHPFGRVSFGANWAISGGGYVVSSGVGSFLMGLDFEKGDRLRAVSFERFGDGAADFTGVTVWSYVAGVLTNIGSVVVTDPGAAWVTEPITPLTETEMTAGKSAFIEFVGNAANLRVGNVIVTVRPALDMRG